MSDSLAQSSLPPSTLIICTRDRPALLVDTIESVFHGEDVPSEIIIVDQSREHHPSIAELRARAGCELRYLWVNSVGLCCARNAGIAAARTGIITFIDDDLLVAQSWYGTLIRALLEAGPRSVVTGRMLPGESEQVGGFVPALVTSAVPRVYAGRINTNVLPGCHMAMFRAAFVQVGDFDERLGPGCRFESADDNDYGFRLLEAGYRIIYVPKAVIYHRAWRGDRDYYPTRWNYGRGKGGYYSKYASLKDPYMLRRMV